MSRQPLITIPKLATNIGKAPRTIERHIKKLREEGKVQREGSSRKGKWRTNNVGYSGKYNE